jgi:DNA-binding MarR family transcriptional regulator
MGNNANQEIERQLTLLLRRAHRVLVSTEDGDIALEAAAYGTMCKLADAGPQNLAALADAFGLDPSTITRHVRTLEDRGFVVRNKDPHDRRMVVLDLTFSGRVVLEQSRRHRRTRLEQMLADWPEADRQDFGRLIKEFNASMNRLSDY